jgi:tRNA threonylcarbamoyladenosine biosynthesis protein TsaE
MAIDSETSPSSPAGDLRQITLFLPDSQATDALGAELATWIALSGDGLTIHLSGDLGAGKTTLVRALLRALGVTGPIKSPTFTLMEPYVVQMSQAGGINQNVSLYCYHFDFYRFTDPREWLEAGFREHFDDHALCLVEWPEKAQAEGHLPSPDVAIAIDVRDAGRSATLTACSARGDACLAAVASSRARLAQPQPIRS